MSTDCGDVIVSRESKPSGSDPSRDWVSWLAAQTASGTPSIGYRQLVLEAHLVVELIKSCLVEVMEGGFQSIEYYLV